MSSYYEPGIIKELRDAGWDQCRITSPRSDRFGLGFSAVQLVSAWDSTQNLLAAAEAENAQLREAIAALTAAMAS